MTNQAKGIGGSLAALGVAWSWFSQVTSVVGLVGIVEDLKVWLRTAAWCTERVRAAAPQLADFLAGLGAAIHAGLEFFRGLYRPIFEFLFGWLPFDVPVLAMDILVVAIFVAASRWRIGSAYLKQWIKLGGSDQAKLLAAAKEMGVACAPQDTRRLEAAINGYQQGKHFGAVPDYLAEDLAWARAQFGDAFAKFADAQPPFWDIGDAKRRLLGGEARLKILIYALAAITAVFLAAEYLWFR